MFLRGVGPRGGWGEPCYTSRHTRRQQGRRRFLSVLRTCPITSAWPSLRELHTCHHCPVPVQVPVSVPGRSQRPLHPVSLWRLRLVA
jgi:hypothetical protein